MGCQPRSLCVGRMPARCSLWRGRDGNEGRLWWSVARGGVFLILKLDSVIELYAGIFLFQFNPCFSCFTSSQVVYRKPPWTLQDILQCLKKHWIAVFGQIIQRKKLQLVLNLIDFFQSSKFSRLALVYAPRLHWVLHWFLMICGILLMENNECRLYWAI